MPRWVFAALGPLFGVLFSGCVVGRTITDVGAHDAYNNYKVQTATTRFALITVWMTSEVWTCHKEGIVFHCTELGYAETKAGFKGSGPPVAPAPIAAPPPPAPVVAPAPAAPPPPPVVAPPKPAPAPPAAAPSAPAPAASSAPAPPPPPATPPTPKRNDLYDAPRH